MFLAAAVAAAYIATYHVTGGGASFDATAYVRGSDYRIDAVLSGVTYEMGRHGTQYWRRTPAGVVRVIGADVQSDPLDRWPRAIFANDGFPLPAREVDRDGSHIMRYTFTDSKHWTISGYGGDATVQETSRRTASVTKEQVAIPQTQPREFQLPQNGTAEIPAFFEKDGRISAAVKIDGQDRTWTVDTGTSQMLIDIGEAARLGLHPLFGHVVIPELRVGDAVAFNVPAQAVDLFHGTVAGILGNEFFTGHIVHINYQQHKLELIDPAHFKPPDRVMTLTASFDEGVPLVTCRVEQTSGSRFAIDTGSYWVLLSSTFVERVGLRQLDTISLYSRPMLFLEGPLWARLSIIPDFSLGAARLGNIDGKVEISNEQNLQIPIDGIVGTEVLRVFEWWYDYDDGMIWAR